MKYKYWLFFPALAAGLLLLLFTTSVSTVPHAVDPDRHLQHQLALRELAHHLRNQANDFSQPIFPIQRLGQNTYVIPLETDVQYSQLRSVVDATLHRHAIPANYRLSLLDCECGEVVLGFLANQADPTSAVACEDREQTNDCYHLRMDFPPTPPNIASTPALPLGIRWLLVGLFVTGPLIWWRRKRIANAAADPLSNTAGIQLADSTFDLTNQQLWTQGRCQSLTYREAKLLHFFFTQPDQVLEREQILAAVWEDEGIKVSRSLDVFVSRLRKKLRADPRLRIANVHGVGYRLEVAET